MEDSGRSGKQTLEVVVFRRPDPEVLRALSAAAERGSEVLVLCVLHPGKDSLTVRPFWDCQVHAELPHVPLMIGHEAETPVAELLPQLACILGKKHPAHDIRFVILSGASQHWGSLRLPLLVRRLRRRLDVSLHERREAGP